MSRAIIVTGALAMRQKRSSRALAAAALAVFALTACESNDPQRYVASATKYLEKNDLKAAIIELRNARQHAPASGEIRFMLGAALLDNGEAAAAEADLRKALEYGHPREAVLPRLARALLAQGEARKVTTEFGQVALNDANANAELMAALSVAWLAQGDVGEARKAVEASLAAKPDYAPALVVRAQLLAASGDLAEAEKTVDRALAKAPNQPEATILKAEMVAFRGRRDEALALVSAALEANPGSAALRLTLIPMALRAGDVKRAETELAALRKIAPKAPGTSYVQALVALAQGNAGSARESTRAILAAQPDNVPALLLDGMANYQLRSYAAAEASLRPVVQRVPNAAGPQRLLVATYLRSGRSAQALDTVTAALRRMPDDPVLLRLAGEAQIQSGDVQAAMRQYERAAAAEQGGSIARIRLAQIRLASGQSDKALSDLDALSASDVSATQADVTRYAAHMSRREYDQALEAVAALEKKQPGALPHELRGNVMLAKRDFASARAEFAKALEADPKRLPAARQLATLDLMEGKSADARARYQKIIAADPQNERAYLALAELQALSGAPGSEVKEALDRAIRANPGAPAARMALIGYLQRTGDAKAALEAARAATTAIPDDPALLEALGAVQLAVGESAQARETFTRLVKLLPKSPAALLRLAEAHRALKDVPATTETLRAALAIQADYVPALVALAGTQIRAGKPDDALADARRLQREQPDSPVGYALEAEILAAQKKFVDAAAAMQKAAARRPSPILAARVFALFIAANKPDAASMFAQRWEKEHPNDATFRSLIAQHRQVTGDIAGAINGYRAALEADPDNVVALNNLAWLLNEDGRSEARDYAERAYKLAPLNPNVVNTYGWVLVTQDEAKRGVELLRAAAALAPADLRLRMTLARGLIKAGDRDAARRELENVVKRDTRSVVKPEAEKLLRQL